MADGREPVWRYGEILGKSLWKTFFIQWLIFILFDASFSTSVTKLYPTRNRGISRTYPKSKMEFFVTKLNGFQLEVLHLLQLSCLLFSTLIFSLSINIFRYFSKLTGFPHLFRTKNWGDLSRFEEILFKYLFKSLAFMG